MDFAVITNNEVIGYVVNSPNEEEAKRIAKAGVENTNYYLKPCKPRNISSMFHNCYFDVETLNSFPKVK